MSVWSDSTCLSDSFQCKWSFFRLSVLQCSLVCIWFDRLLGLRDWLPYYDTSNVVIFFLSFLYRPWKYDASSWIKLHGWINRKVDETLFPVGLWLQSPISQVLTPWLLLHCLVCCAFALCNCRSHYFTTYLYKFLRSSRLGWEWRLNRVIILVLHCSEAANNVFVQFSW